MNEVPEDITYKTKDIIESIKLINFLLISLRKIGDYAIDIDELEIKDEIFDFLVNENVLDKLAEIRMVLESQFDDFPRVEDKSFLEVVTEDIQYWDYKK